MIEIVYSGLVAGSLYASKLINKGDLICTVDLMLEVGFLDEEYDSKYRRNLYDEMYAYNFSDLDEGMGEYFDHTVSDITQMKDRASSGEPIRIWADANTMGRCNTAFISCVLMNINGLGEVSIMDQPQFNYKDKSVYFCNSWAHFQQDGLKEYLPLQRRMTNGEMKYHADEWHRVTEENSNLRTLICNQLRSVPPDFYDEEILRHISYTAIKERVAVGNFLDDTKYNINSLIPCWRIAELIKAGKIELVSEANQGETYLSRLIKKI